MNLDDYSYEYDGRRYIDPQVSLDAQNAFIDNLRNTQAQNNAEIQQQTYVLGTRVPSNLGGLSGGSSYFKSRYQTPQMNSMVAGLKTAAQAQALSTLLQNEIDKAKKKYKDAYNKANKVGGANGTNGPIDVETKDDGSSEPSTIRYKETVPEVIGSDSGWSNIDWDRTVANSEGKYKDRWWLPDWLERGWQTGNWYFGSNKGKG